MSARQSKQTGRHLERLPVVQVLYPATQDGVWIVSTPVRSSSSLTLHRFDDLALRSYMRKLMEATLCSTCGAYHTAAC